MSVTVNQYSKKHVGEVPVLNGKVVCQQCHHENKVYTPKNQGTKDHIRLTGKRASHRHLLIIVAFLDNPQLSLTINDIVKKVNQINGSNFDKADITHDRADLVSWKVLDLTGVFDGTAPFYYLKNIAKAVDLASGGVF